MSPDALTIAWYDKFYDRARRDPKHQYSRHPAKCVYGPMWIHALTWIGDKERILDLGCGPGQFARLAIRAGKTYERGVDFSRSAIVWARERNPTHPKAFDVCDLGHPKATAGKYDVAVLFEVLEHLADDVGLLKRLRPGVHVIFSVPNFAHKGHVRSFAKPQRVADRYGALLTLGELYVAARGKDRIWMFNARRKDARSLP